MTNEEAIKRLKSDIYKYSDFTENPNENEFWTAFDMAIKALKQEPCEDISDDGTLTVNVEDGNKVSRVLVCGDNHFGGLYYPEQEPCEDATLKDIFCMGCEYKEQEPKTGHWIMPVQDDGMSEPIFYQVRCSECGFDLDPQTWHMELHQYGADKYCPNCGARMAESEE